jgi:two-component system, cell cycle response regulator
MVKPLKILMVDDSATSRLVLQRALERLGHETLVAQDGVEAWSSFVIARPSVVISDWIMPRMDGAELCRRIREDTDGPYTYFVMLTSLEDKQHVLDGMRVGADDYLTKPLDEHELEVRLVAAARVTALHGRLEDLSRRLHLEARVDPLTRVGNRLRLREDLEALAGRMERYGYGSSVALFDVDGFKAFNDMAGHLAGDEVLATVAGELRRQMRRGDEVYRYGGEEFVVIFPEQDTAHTRLAAERMRAAIERLALDHPAGGVVTVSAGVAVMDAAEADTPEAALKRADDALYRAKEAGRNRVEAAE